MDVSTENTVKLFTDQQMANAASICTPVLESMSSALRAQSEYLQRLEGLTAEALRRRRDGCAAMQNLFTQMGAARDMSDVFRAEQEWLSSAVQRAIADVSCWQTYAIEGAQRFGMPGLTAAFGPNTAPGKESRFAA